MGMNITNSWQIFSDGVKRNKHEKLIGIREFSERLSLDFFNNTFTNDTGTTKILSLYLIRSMMERQFIISTPLIFPVLILVPYKVVLFMTSISIVLHRQTLLWRILLLVLSIILKKNELKTEEDMTGLLQVTVTKCYPM